LMRTGKRQRNDGSAVSSSIGLGWLASGSHSRCWNRRRLFSDYYSYSFHTHFHYSPPPKEGGLSRGSFHIGLWYFVEEGPQRRCHPSPAPSRACICFSFSNLTPVSSPSHKERKPLVTELRSPCVLSPRSFTARHPRVLGFVFSLPIAFSSRFCPVAIRRAVSSRINL